MLPGKDRLQCLKFIRNKPQAGTWQNWNAWRQQSREIFYLDENALQGVFIFKFSAINRKHKKLDFHWNQK